MKTKTKSIMTICLAVALVAVAVLGTIAYMTATSYKENTFTVGDFEIPTTPPKDLELEEGLTIENYICEPSWVDGSKLMPGKSIAKDPYVGIGKGSDPAYVYVYVDNKTLNSDAIGKYVTFTLNEKWEAVDAAEVDEKIYASGLFRYKGSEGETGILDATDADVWTAAPIFEKVNVSATATKDDFVAVSEGNAPKMTVYAYIHQAMDNGETIDVNTVNKNAKAWSKKAASK